MRHCCRIALAGAKGLNLVIATAADATGIADLAKMERVIWAGVPESQPLSI